MFVTTKKLASIALALSLAGVLSFASSAVSSADMPESAVSISTFFSEEGVVTTPTNYPTLETARQMLKVQDDVGVNGIQHRRQLTPTDEQAVVRMNRDTYYSFALVDVSEGAIITIPEVPEGKYVSIQPITEDHRIQPMSYGSGTFPLATHIGDHMHVVIRLDATFTEAEAKYYQDQMVVNANSAIPFTAVPVQESAFETVEAELKRKMPMILKRDGIYAVQGMFTAPTDGSRGFFDAEKYQVGAAIGWGGAQWNDNIYEVSGNYPAEVCHQATFENPDNAAFWSITVYDEAGFMFNDVANVSSNTATPNADATYTVSFGCGADAPNNIETMNDTSLFNLGIRHYVPGTMVREEGYRLLPYVKAQ